jgi:methylsterol monooxygenase
LGGVYSYYVLNSEKSKQNRILNTKFKKNVLKQHFPLISFNLITLYVITAISLYFFQDYFSFALPSIYIFAAQVCVIMLLDDTFFYFFHKLLHVNDYLFKTIHKIHHRACPPFPLDFIYVHPLEWMGGATGMGLGIASVYLIFGEINVFAFWAYAAFRNLHEIEIHSGQKSWFGKYIPLWGTTEHHELHHSKPFGNYASTFTFWDKIFKTEMTIKKDN